MLLLDTLKQNDITLPPVKVAIDDNNNDRNSTLRSILTYNGRKYHVDCKTKKFDKRYHLHVDGLGEFTFDETGTNLIYATRCYDEVLMKKLVNIVDTWKKRFSDF